MNLLIESGAPVDAKDANGDSALDWARRRGSREVAAALERKSARGRAAGGPQRALRPMGADNTVAKAVAAALPLLQQASDTFFTKSAEGCVSCHHQSLPAVALQVSCERGFRVDEEKAKLQAETTLRLVASRRERFLQGAGVVDRLDAGYWLLGLDASGVTRNETTDALVHYLTLQQANDGHWRPTLPRPPANDSDCTATALAMRGLVHFGPPGRRAEIAGRIEKARNWLLKATPKTTEARTFHLFGLKWAAASKLDIDKAAAGLLAQQRVNGGWGQLESMPSDAYATGESLVALRQAGDRSPTDPAYRHGVQFLLRTRLDDGSWFVESRSLLVQPYFESGFPHGWSQFISCFATSWATMALVLTADPLEE